MDESVSIDLLFRNGGKIMSVLYVKEQGSIVQKRGERIVVTKGSMTLLEIPVANVENIAILGVVPHIK